MILTPALEYALCELAAWGSLDRQGAAYMHRPHALVSARAIAELYRLGFAQIRWLDLAGARASLAEPTGQGLLYLLRTSPGKQEFLDWCDARQAKRVAALLRALHPSEGVHAG